MDVLAVFRIAAPEFSEVEDATILANLDFYADLVSRKNFGRFYERAVALLTAHYMALANTAAQEGSGSSSITAGAVIREKEGELERQYSESTDGNELLAKTIYGQQYLALRRVCIIPLTVRGIGYGICGR